MTTETTKKFNTYLVAKTYKEDYENTHGVWYCEDVFFPCKDYNIEEVLDPQQIEILEKFNKGEYFTNEELHEIVEFIAVRAFELKSTADYFS